MIGIATMNMKQLRERTGQRVEAIAHRLGIAVSTVRNWEAGTSEPTPAMSKVPLYLEVYQCSLEEFVEAVEESRKKREG